MKETIAIVAWGAMADVLYATPIVSQVRRMSPDADISWLVRDKFAPVVDDNPDIDHVVRFTLPEGHASRQDAEYAMDREILKYARDRYDRVIDLQYWPRYSNFYERIGEDFISLRCRNADLPIVPRDQRNIVLGVPAQEQARAMRFVQDQGLGGVSPRFITVNHISYAASPVWSLDNYRSLVAMLAEHNIKAVFTGAPNEPLPEGAIDARGMPYLQWAEVIRLSDLWLGLDSGAVALACASKVPIIKLHSPDFPISKTGIKSMGLRQDKVLELCPAPNVESLARMIVENMR